jgi:hypothetical protein
MEWIKICPIQKIEDNIFLFLHFPGLEKMIDFRGEVKRTGKDDKRLNIGCSFRTWTPIPKPE